MAWTTLSRLNRDGRIERIAHGVYRLRGAPPADHLELRAAWLQLVPDVPAWRRLPEQGVVSHRSAAVFCGLGHLPADTPVHVPRPPAEPPARRPDPARAVAGSRLDVAAALAPHAHALGGARGDGVGLLSHLLELTANPRAAEWSTAAGR